MGRPPRVSRWILSLVTPGDERGHLLDELYLEYAQLGRTEGWRGRPVAVPLAVCALSPE